MENYLDIRVPVERGGTNKKDRAIQQLMPDYVQIEERSIEDFKSLVATFANTIKFIGDNNEYEELNWASFFVGDPSELKKQPHYALFLAFLKILEYSKANLNSFTKRYLDYYYQQVLQFTKKNETPDKVHVILELAKNISSLALKQGEMFYAGKDQLGIPLYYTLDRDTEFNKTQIVSLYNLYMQTEDEIYKKTITETIEKKPDYKAKTAPQTDSDDPDSDTITITKEVDYALPNVTTITSRKHYDQEYEIAPHSAWNILGKEIPGEDEDEDTSVIKTELGLAIASPMFVLNEGTRKVELEIIMNKPREDDDILRLEKMNNDLTSDFILIYSIGEEWLEINPQEQSSFEKSISFKPVTGEGSGYTLKINFTIPNHAPAFAPYTGTNHFANQSEWPMVKILFNPESSNFCYSKLKPLQINTTHIRVDVQGVRNLVLQNDQSVLNPGKPFEPFGSQAPVGSKFYIGSAEIFSKKIKALTINLHWHDAPDWFSKYYSAYNELTDKEHYRTNALFTANVEILKNKTWFHVNNTKIQLFNPESNKTSPLRTISLLPGVTENIPNGIHPLTAELISEDPDLKELDDYNIHTQRGFIRLSLNAHFGHQDFQKVFSRVVKQNNELKADVLLDIPESPYTPTLQSATIDYKAEKTFTRNDMRAENLMHVHPFGVAPYDIYNETPFLFPQYHGEGSLFIGLQDLKAPCELSILFQMVEGTADPYTKIPEIEWYYLTDNQWYKLKPMQVLTNATNSFNKPGVVTLSISEDITNNNTVLPNGKFWLQAKAESNALGSCKVIDITTQVAQLTFTDQHNDVNHLAQPLAPESIKKLKSPQPAVKKIHQPYASFGGKTKELDKDFYVRISERLRHKGRAVTQWDFEHLILDKFPELYKVKCFKHTSWDKAYDPGSVLILAIPDVRNSNLENKFKPYTNIDLLDQVSKYIKTLCPPYVKVDTHNPYYEEIQVSFLVKFIDGINKGLYEQQLQEEIKQFLTPWAYDKGKDILFGSTIYRSSILNFVEERDYVDFVTFFKINHTDLTGTPLYDLEEATASTPLSILVSAQEHHIRVIDDIQTLCADGIGHMIVENTFSIIK